MMSPVTQWLTTKSLDFITEYLKQSFLDKNIEGLIYQQNIEIIHNLKLLIDAPYKQAIMHLRLNEIECAKNKLIEALSMNEFDISARLLYIRVLLYLGYIQEAIEQYWKLYCDFTFDAALFPNPIYDIFNSTNIMEPKISERDFEFRIGHDNDFTNYQADNLLIFARGIICSWVSEKHFLGFPYCKYGMTIVDWNNNCLVERHGYHEIIYFSYNFVIYKCKENYYLFNFSLKTETFLSEEQIRKYFRRIQFNPAKYRYNADDIKRGVRHGKVFIKKGPIRIGCYSEVRCNGNFGSETVSLKYKYGTLTVHIQ